MPKSVNDTYYRVMQEAKASAEVLKWSPQQEGFLEWCKNGTGSCVLIAVAGAGKTTVLLAAGEAMQGGIAYVAYNKDIVTETKAKLAERGIDWKKMQAGTAHSFGFSALRKQLGDVKVEGYKVSNILDGLFLTRADDMSVPEFNRLKELEPFKANIQQLVSLAKQGIFGVGNSDHEDDSAWYALADHHDIFDDEDRPPVERIVHLAQQVLQWSNAQDDVIDFDDMIYLPLLYRAPFWKFDVVMVDEAQDTNRARRALVRAMVKRGGRVIAVGDPHQAIYGFTGADSDALELIKQDFNAIELPLTVSYRCPQNVVKFAQQWVSHIQAAPTAPEGTVAAVTMEDFLKRNDLTAGSAVLSRTNAPNVELAFQLIRQRIPCRIEGRDIAKSIVKMMTRWKIKTIDQLQKKMALHLEKETTKLLAAKKEVQLARLQDTIETINVVIDECRKAKEYTIDEAVTRINNLFGEDVKNVLVLSSIHKSKGREWETVFWLDRQGTCPSKWARQKWQQEQEKNLQYVAATRAKSNLIDIIVPPKEKAA
jgi:DNA helicase-2/ATP-dependent DNA helicase PcrA